MPVNGSYSRMFYLNPNTLLELFDVPEGYGVRSVHYVPVRNAFAVILDTPEEPVYFVEPSQPIPELPVAVTHVSDDHGGQHLKVQMTFPMESKRAGRRQSQKVS